MGSESVLTVRYWAGARAAAGTAEEQVTPAPLPDVLGAIIGRRPDLARTLSSCSFLLDGVQIRRDATGPLPTGGVLDVLPPFAGG